MEDLKESIKRFQALLDATAHREGTGNSTVSRDLSKSGSIQSLVNNSLSHSLEVLEQNNTAHLLYALDLIETYKRIELMNSINYGSCKADRKGRRPTTRKRVIIPSEIVAKLESFFQENHSPNRSETLLISESTGLDPIRVRRWFKNKRYRSR